MDAAGTLIKTARLDARLTQRQLADRLGITQAAVAQLERSRSNPTIATLDRALRATGRRMELRAVPAEPNIDVSLLRDALEMTPAQRLATGAQLFRDANRLATAAARSRR